MWMPETLTTIDHQGRATRQKLRLMFCTSIVLLIFPSPEHTDNVFNGADLASMEIKVRMFHRSLFLQAKKRMTVAYSD